MNRDDVVDMAAITKAIYRILLTEEPGFKYAVGDQVLAEWPSMGDDIPATITGRFRAYRLQFDSDTHDRTYAEDELAPAPAPCPLAVGDVVEYLITETPEERFGVVTDVDHMPEGFRAVWAGGRDLWCSWIPDDWRIVRKANEEGKA